MEETIAGGSFGRYQPLLPRTSVQRIKTSYLGGGAFLQEFMTGYTVNTGSSKKFSSGWDRIFATRKPTSGKKSAENSTGKTKTAGKKGGKK